MSISESEVRTLLDLSPICNKIIDLDGKLQFMSLAGIKRLKITNVEEHYGKKYPFSFLPKETQDDLSGCCKRAIAGETCSIDTPAIDTDGCELWFSTKFVPVFNRSGQIKFVIASSVDISEEMKYRNHLEQMVIEKTKEKVDLQQHLFQAQKSKAIGSLAAGIAHDFNNVLSMILGNVELQQHHVQHNNFSVNGLNECFENVINAISRARELSGQLTGFAKKEQYDVRPIDVNLLVDELGSLLRQCLTSTQRIVFTTDLQAKSFVEADAGQVHQVIQNLVVNARDAMPDGGEILVSTRDTFVDNDRMSYGGTISVGKYVVLSVKDSGVGIKEEVLGNIFDPFFTTKMRETGTGLGLASVWGIIENHNGYVEVKTQLDKGTVFDIYFPAVDPVSDEKGIHEVDHVRELVSRVLVVDDEAAIRNLIKDYLATLGIDVLLASDGEEALRTYNSERVDMVITDLVMDPIDGLELYFELRKVNPEVIVYLMSGYHEDEKVKRVLADGAHGFLKKPFRLAELKNAIQLQLPNAKSRSPNKVQTVSQ